MSGFGKIWFVFGEQEVQDLADIADRDGDIATGIAKAKAEEIIAAHNAEVERMDAEIWRLRQTRHPHPL